MGFIFVLLSALFFSMSFSQDAHSAVWQTTNSWNQDWEVRYQDWVAKAWDKNVFLKTGTAISGLSNDCADNVYTVRAYFAFLHGLPFAMKDPSTYKMKLITNEMTKWDNLSSQDQKVRAFIVYLHGVGSTASLPNDSYPTAISRSTLHSGSFILTDKKNHHSWVIRLFMPTGIPHLIFASRPAQAKLFERKEYPTVGFVFPTGIRPETNAGFRNFRTPDEIGLPVEQVRGFSLEQYHISPRGYMKAIQKRMQLVNETHDARIDRLIDSVCIGFTERIDAVTSAIKKNQEIGSRCMTATEYDDYSTPSRDARFKDSFIDLIDAYQEGLNSQDLSAVTRAKMNAIASGVGPDSSISPCTQAIAPGINLSLGQIYQSIMAGKLSNNPHDTLQMRWGLARFPSAKASACPVY